MTRIRIILNKLDWVGMRVIHPETVLLPSLLKLENDFFFFLFLQI